MRRLGATAHVAQHDMRRRAAIDGRTTRPPGDAIDLRKRKRIGAVFGWMVTLTAAACNPAWLANLLTVAA